MTFKECTHEKATTEQGQKTENESAHRADSTAM